MRISDGSSDVCSSDLVARREFPGAETAAAERRVRLADAAEARVLAGQHIVRDQLPGLVVERVMVRAERDFLAGDDVLGEQAEAVAELVGPRAVRKSVLEGTCDVVRVERGGSRLI